jgi:hypothetical protein
MGANIMIQAWHDFFGMLGAAAATLLGLLFVSVSINADVILGESHKHTMDLAEQAFHNYMAVVIVSLAAFYPGISNTSFGASLLCLSVVYAGRLLNRFYKSLRTRMTRKNRIESLRRYLSTLGGFVTFIVGGAQMMLDNQIHAIIALGGLVLIISATVISWELLISVARTKYGAGKKDS